MPGTRRASGGQVWTHLSTIRATKFSNKNMKFVLLINNKT